MTEENHQDAPQDAADRFLQRMVEKGRQSQQRGDQHSLEVGLFAAEYPKLLEDMITAHERISRKLPKELKLTVEDKECLSISYQGVTLAIRKYDESFNHRNASSIKYILSSVSGNHPSGQKRMTDGRIRIVPSKMGALWDGRTNEGLIDWFLDMILRQIG